MNDHFSNMMAAFAFASQQAIPHFVSEDDDGWHICVIDNNNVFVDVAIVSSDGVVVPV